MSKMFKDVEEKWNKKWKKSDMYKAEDFGEQEKKYVLVEFPYPSGSGLHIGHAFTMTGADVYARYMRMKGFNTLFPMGWDAFGLPTENYAIKKGIHPVQATKENTDRFREQMDHLAFSFDWNREVNTTDPDYYKWTQWIFIKLYEEGLAYKDEKPINWCPSCKVGLANEEVIDGNCERCGAETTKRNIRQWIVKITEYADRLLEGLKKTDFVEKVKMAQINWIDRSEGAKVEFQIDGRDDSLDVFTTRPDTLWGATFMVIAPEHWLTQDLMDNDEIADYVRQAAKKSELERAELQKDKTGVFTGLYAVNPVNEKKIPIWVSDFVLATYGTGAIMAVPAHDERDFEFAKKFELKIIPVIEPNDGWDFDESAYTDVTEGKMINSDFINDMSPEKAIKKTIDWLEEQKFGEKDVNYHLRDWIFSRQHYWGEPIPMVKCEKCGWVPVAEEDLPIVLPDVEAYEPTDTGESPLAKIRDWVETECPECGGPAERETDTMPNWAGSDWYFLRYLDPNNDNAIADMKKMEYWMPVDVYIGGDEHNTLHLLYSRFIYQFLWDIDAVPKDVPEPYYRRISHGVILGPDNHRMSKSRGNVIVPDDVASEHGADATRTYLMFMGPFEATMAWNENTLIGVRRFIDRVYDYFVSNLECIGEETSEETEVMIHKTVKKVTEDVGNFRFNTAIAALMEATNFLEKNETMSKVYAEKFVKLISIFMPYTAEELWEMLGNNDSVHTQDWPEYDEKFLVQDTVVLPVQINGKIRSKVEVDVDLDESAVRNKVMKDETIKTYLQDKDVRKFIYVPKKIVSIVV